MEKKSSTERNGFGKTQRIIDKDENQMAKAIRCSAGSTALKESVTPGIPILELLSGGKQVDSSERSALLNPELDTSKLTPKATNVLREVHNEILEGQKEYENGLCGDFDKFFDEVTVKYGIPHSDEEKVREEL